MINLSKNGVFLINNQNIIEKTDNLDEVFQLCKERNIEIAGEEALNECWKNTIAYSILNDHHSGGSNLDLHIKFDAVASHDITYVGIIQTAKASGLKKFPLPYVLTNCHNSLCAVGGTINEDDHLFGLSAAKKFGGIFVPAHQAVIHQYVREMITGCGKMILGSDSHTRYGALGTMGIGEGGPEIVKQLLEDSYDIKYPEVICVYLEGHPRQGVGPQDVALAIISNVFKNGYAKNKVLEFTGPGVSQLSMDFRNGIDVMTTETACLSSLWCTDEKVKEYYKLHNREDEFQLLSPGKLAYYDGLIRVDLSKIEPMIALPFHPSNAYTITEVKENLADYLDTVEHTFKEKVESDVKLDLVSQMKEGNLELKQGVVAGCSGGSFENIACMAGIIQGNKLKKSDFNLSIYPASQPINISLMNQGISSQLLKSGIILRSAFCGPCFGAGDVPANNTFSIRHVTRNFINREGSKPSDGQIAVVGLMDVRSIAATFINGGVLTSAFEVEVPDVTAEYHFDPDVYENKVYRGFHNPIPTENLRFGPNIVDWPKKEPLPENLLLRIASVINDPVTTTDELIPSGETSSYRSNPLRLAEYTLQRKDPRFVFRAKENQKLENQRKQYLAKQIGLSEDLESIFKILKNEGLPISIEDTLIGNLIYANKPGDGSAREQAASCQKVLDVWVNIAREYATKRYRSNLINWGILPFIFEEDENPFQIDDFLYIPDIRKMIAHHQSTIPCYLIRYTNASEPETKIRKIELKLQNLTETETKIVLSGNLINFNRKRKNP